MCSLRVLKHTGEPADLQLRRVPGDSHALLLFIMREALASTLVATRG